MLAEVACWLYTAERQSAVLRSQGAKILLQQDLGYFDHFAGNGEFVSQISKDVLSVHDILSEKVTTCLHSSIAKPKCSTLLHKIKELEFSFITQWFCRNILLDHVLKYHQL